MGLIRSRVVKLLGVFSPNSDLSKEEEVNKEVTYWVRVLEEELYTPVGMNEAEDNFETSIDGGGQDADCWLGTLETLFLTVDNTSE